MDKTTERVLEFFRPLTRIPRPSKQEEAIAKWLTDWATARGFEARRDATGNLVIAAPASPGAEAAPTVVLQGHMDMVCEKTPDSPIDPATDGVRLVFDGEWLKADRTTLGADNGIAIAMALAVLADPALKRPALEVLLTVDEETGLTGALELDPALVTGRIMINLDSEDEGVLTVGCAGGRAVDVVLPLTREPRPEGLVSFTLHARGMFGGHSGVDIHLQRANANIALARALRTLTTEHGARIDRIHGGSAHNAIPRDAWATLALDPARREAAEAALATLVATLRAEHRATDPDLELSLEPIDAPSTDALTDDSTHRMVLLLLSLPHGVARMSTDFEGLVQTSNNLATLRMDPAGETLTVHCSQRSSIASELNTLCERVAAIGTLAGARVAIERGYPGWAPDPDSTLLAQCKLAHETRFGKSPVIEVIHAGLECGVIGEKLPDMQMISFGPTIRNPHSPDERLHLPSVATCYTLLTDVLGVLAG